MAQNNQNISRIQTIQNDSGASYVNSLATTIGSDITQGNFIVLIITTSNPATDAVLSVTDSQGNTYVKQNSYTGLGNVSLDFWYCQNAKSNGSAPTITITLKVGNFNTISVIGGEYSGIPPGAPNPNSFQIDATVEVQESSFVTSHPAGNTGITKQNNELVIAAYAYTNASITLTETSGGYSAVVNRSNATQFTGMGYADKVVTPTGAQTATFSSGATSTKGIIFVVTIKGFNYIDARPTIKPAPFKPSKNRQLRTQVKIISAAVTNYSATITDSITLTETLIKSTSTTKSDSISLTETLIKATSKTIADSITLTETLTKNTGKILSDSVTLTESLVKQTGKFLTETITLTETLTHVSTFFRTLTDSITLTETLTKLTGKTFSDSITLTESISHLIGKAFSESITLTETLTKATTRTISESISLTETLLKSVTKVVTDSVTLTETLAKAVTRTITESISLTETLQKSCGKMVTETVTLTETLLKAISKPFNESISLNEALTHVSTFFRSFTEQITLNETLIKSSRKTITENITLTETLRKNTGKFFVESITLIERLGFIINNLILRPTKSFLRMKKDPTVLSQTKGTTVLRMKRDSDIT